MASRYLVSNDNLENMLDVLTALKVCVVYSALSAISISPNGISGPDTLL